MMETTLTGTMNGKLIDELSKIAPRFTGRLVRLIMAEINEQEHKPRGRRNSTAHDS